MSPKIDSKLSLKYREKLINKNNETILITNFHNTEQEKDFQNPTNCNGFGRIRHFTFTTNNYWPKNTLPIQPACNALKLEHNGAITAQVFQNAACNWRCWYCYVPFSLLSANMKYAKWVSVSELIDLYLQEKNRPPVIDLSGGQPDLIPEWIYFFLVNKDQLTFIFQLADKREKGT